MSNVEVLFEVPTVIESGLKNGSLERIGGVIRDANSKTVVAWLREAGTFDASDTHHALRKALGFNLTTANAGLGLGSTFGGLIGLGLVVLSFHSLSSSINKVNSRIEVLSNQLAAEFDHDRSVRLASAVTAARDLLESENQATRDHSWRPAIDGLKSAQHDYVRNFNTLIPLDDTSTRPSREQCDLAYDMLLQALNATIAYVKCYVEFDEIKIARREMREQIEQFRGLVQRLVRAYLEPNGAVYLHRAFEIGVFVQYWRVRRWLDQTGEATLDGLLALIDEIRPDLWDLALVDDEYSAGIAGAVQRVIRRPQHSFENRAGEFSRSLDRCEFLIENFDRLTGYELELASMRLSVAEWKELVSEAEIEANGGLAVLTDRDFLVR
ncbi:MAG: hypothetical protein H3C32_00865 [Anaerolineae bacterium]|nr:hypothetical protein [Anaerolineae bacterium]